MTQRRWMSHFKLAALSVALGLALFASAQGVATAADDEEDSIWNLDRRIIDGFMRGLGLRSGYEDEIDYRERSPLVVPPGRSLPKPEAAGKRNPAWPVDPDVKYRADMAARRKKDAAAAYSYDWEKESATLSPSELAKGRSATNGRANTEEKEPRNPSDLGYVGGLWNFFAPKGEEVGTFTSEPPRTSLTSPPTGYMTPSPAQPYGLSKPRYEKAKPVDRALGELN